MLTLIVCTLLAAGVLTVSLNPRAAKRVLFLGKTGIGNVGRKAENIDPLGQYQEHIDAQEKVIKGSKEQLRNLETLVRSVERQVAEGEKEHSVLNVRIERALADKKPDRAREYASQMARCESQLNQNREQLEIHRKNYDGVAAQVKAAIEKINDAKREAAQLGGQLKASEAERALAEITSSFNLDTSSLTKLDEVREKVYQKIDSNRAYGKIERDVAGEDSLDDYVTEHDAAAESILARYTANAEKVEEPTLLLTHEPVQELPVAAESKRVIITVNH